MTKIYACLTGEWVCLNDDPNCSISDYNKNPYTWWKENAPIYAPKQRMESSEIENSFYGLDYVNIEYKGKNYRINPIFIQIVTE
nr:MAG TPA: hypothetical protein [Caudoviricetes sp.]